MADVTIGDLELGDNPGDGDLFEVEQGGQSKRLTFAQIKAAATGETTLPVGAHRHWRIFIEDAGPSGSSWFARINELRFRKDEADLTLDGTASASAEGHANNRASAAFDGDGSTVWASTATGPAWLAYSFSEAVEVDEISLKAGDTQARADDMPAVFLVEFSDDGENWTSVQSYTTSPWAVDETRLFDVPASYPVSYVPEAPADGRLYGRKDEDWAEITSPSTQSVTPVTAGRPLSANDAGSYLLADNPADILLTVPDDAALNLPVGADITIEQHNDGLVELAPASGVALNVATGFGLKTGGKYAVVSLKKVADNTWTLFGNLEVLP